MFVHVIVIFVAVTSKDEVMMILLISAHFYELKSLVFKRFDERQIFQIASADVVERFVMVLDIGMVLVQGQTTPSVRYWFVVMVVSEVFVDWFKHMFISKFNKVDRLTYVVVLLSTQSHHTQSTAHFYFFFSAYLALTHLSALSPLSPPSSSSFRPSLSQLHRMRLRSGGGSCRITRAQPEWHGHCGVARCRAFAATDAAAAAAAAVATPTRVVWCQTAQKEEGAAVSSY